MKLIRRIFLKASIAATFGALGAAPLLAAEAAPKEIRIGYQKAGVLLIAKEQKRIEDRFKAEGVNVKWIEFAFGPPLLEALNAGAIDYGYTGDAPPIFAQAARANLVYVAAIPARGYGQAIIVRPDSSIKTLADLKGKKVGVGKASSAHNLLVAALESAGLKFSDIDVAYLTPADAGAAYARGAIDAWSIWDPYYAIAEISVGARPLEIDRAVAAQNSYFLANKDFATKYPAAVAAINAEVEQTTKWTADHREEAAVIFSNASGVALGAQKKAIDRAEFSFGPLTDAVIAQQQAVADRFHRIGLIPKPIVVRDIVWTKPGV
jgi:aliphatic sulfonates family ABC transporter substrate-binding protein